MSKNVIIYGDRALDDIKRGDVYIGNALVGDELSVDTLNATVKAEDTEYLPLADNSGIFLADNSGIPIYAWTKFDRLDNYNYGDPLYYYHDGALLGKFYVSEITRVSRVMYDLEATSAIGLLDKVTHYGGMYLGETLAQVMADIIGDTVEYSINPAYADLQIYGWLPVASKRENLHQLLFAMGMSLKKDTAGEIQIAVLANATPAEISADQVYRGGSVTHRTPATGVQVTEHTYLPLPTTGETVLFDGAANAVELVTPRGQAVSGVLVTFDKPCHSLRAEGASILESGANYAVLSNSLQATLYGKEYIHVERTVSRSVPAKGAQNVITSKDCTLVNQFNVGNVADRLMAYYGAAKSISTDLVVTGQKPGQAVALTDPFGDRAEGYIASMDITMSAVLRAQTEIITGYIPVAPGNAYSHVAVITQSGPWIVPPECTSGKVRATIMSGGDGGLMGKAGKAGGSGRKYTSSTGFTGWRLGNWGEGGEPGTPGAGGKVVVVTLDVNVGDAIDATIGAGGIGQTATSAATAGQPSTFGGYSSANGVSSDGVQDPLTGALYGTAGLPGIAGNRGGGTDPSLERDEYGTPGPDLEYLGNTYHAGARGTDYGDYYERRYGGWGGGPAAGANGLNGGNGTHDKAGPGGKGATPVKPPPATVPGQGGQAGHGGGGGGGGGVHRADGTNGPGGPGGDPGPAGDGAPGVIIVFY